MPQYDWRTGIDEFAPLVKCTRLPQSATRSAGRTTLTRQLALAHLQIPNMPSMAQHGGQFKHGTFLPQARARYRRTPAVLRGPCSVRRSLQIRSGSGSPADTAPANEPSKHWWRQRVPMASGRLPLSLLAGRRGAQS